MNTLLAALIVPLTMVLTGLIGPGDTDGDGITDSLDRCPQVAGVEDHLGCSHPVRTDNVKITRPPRTKFAKVKHWHPWSQATPSQVGIILREEQARWGGPWLGNRVACESGYNWAATNGQYGGLLQFGSIWSSMWAGTPRGVKYRTTVKKQKPVIRHTEWTSGKWTHRIIGHVTQKKTVVRIGRLPRYPDAYHSWAAIRVGQRAVSGDGPTTAWSCGL